MINTTYTTLPLQQNKPPVKSQPVLRCFFSRERIAQRPLNYLGNSIFVAVFYCCVAESKMLNSAVSCVRRNQPQPLFCVSCYASQPQAGLRHAHTASDQPGYL